MAKERSNSGNMHFRVNPELKEEFEEKCEEADTTPSQFFRKQMKLFIEGKIK